MSFMDVSIAAVRDGRNGPWSFYYMGRATRSIITIYFQWSLTDAIGQDLTQLPWLRLTTFSVVPANLVARLATRITFSSRRQQRRRLLKFGP